MDDDFLQDTARSSFADMLNDDERNRAFDHGIQISVRALVKSKLLNPSGDKHFKCCDIGTGSGLLSMMIVRAFKNLNYDNFHVYSFEAFEPMAICARRVIACNNMADKITVIVKRSVEYKIASYLHKQINLLVAELLDTELIGEGCLETYRHAVQNLCSTKCLFVPHQARIYIEPVASSFLFRRHAIEDLNMELDNGEKINLTISRQVKDCCGLSDMDDMQASMLRVDHDITRITEPQIAFHFLFNRLETLQLEDRKELSFTIQKEVEQPVVVVMWWDIIMYDKELTDTVREQDRLSQVAIDFYMLSCAPTWARDKELLLRDQRILSIYGREVWREHWIQAVYYFSDVVRTRKLVGLRPSDKLLIYAYHDEYSLRFELNSTVGDISCSCGIHRRFSRTQLSSINRENLDLIKYLKASLNDLLQSECTLFGKINFGSDAIDSPISWSFTIADFNMSRDMLSMFGEVPWQSTLHKIFTGINIDFIKDLTIKCTQVELDNLNRMVSTIGDCEGFNLTQMDDLITKASRAIDENVESHYLWEYGARRLDADHVCFTVNLRDLDNVGTLSRKLHLPITNFQRDWKKGWALVFWVEFKLIPTGDVISSGPTNQCNIDDYIEWNRYCKQPIHFMHDHQTDNQQIVDVEVSMNYLGRLRIRRLNKK